VTRAAAPADETVDGLARLADDAVRLLAAAGEVDAACRLAARAWWLAEPRAPRAANRLNATLHHLTRVYEKGPQ
jgi:hypothetical protein